ncbi:hypothetical protein SLE2022_139780 [Rubroshorea leprosula]
MEKLIRCQMLNSRSRYKLFNFKVSKIGNLHLSTVSRSPKLSQPKKTQKRSSKNEVETSSMASLFNQITEILGVGNINPDETPSGISILNRTDVRDVVFNQESPAGMQAVCRNAEESVLMKKEENLSVSDDFKKANEVEFDVSPVVHEITQIVRDAHSVVSMEERLENSGIRYEPGIVEKVLKRCFKVPHLALRFFTWVKKREGFCHNTETYNTMLYIAGESKNFWLVEELLEEMEEKSCNKDIKTWTILISQYGKAKLIGKALSMFEEMRRYGIEPDAAAYKMIISSLCNAKKCELALEFFKEMVQKEIALDLTMCKRLLNCLARSGNSVSVHSVAEDMTRVFQIPEREVYDHVLRSFCISGRIKEALEIIRDLKNKELSLNPGYFEILVKGLCKADRITDALEIVDIMKRRQLVTSDVYGILISGYLRRNDLSKALDLFKSMKESGYFPTTSTYTELMQRFFRLNQYQKGCELYNEMLDNGIEPDIVAITAIIAGHVRQNHISEAWKVFESMEEKGIRPTWKSYSVFIKELCKVERTGEILKVLNKMQASKFPIRDEVLDWVISCMERKGEMNNVEKVKQMQRILTSHSQVGQSSGNNIASGEDPSLELNHNQPEIERTDCNLIEPFLRNYSEHDLQQVCRILSSPVNWCLMQEALEKCSIQFTPELVLEILRKCTLQGKAALLFFSWVGKQAGYQHTTETYNMAMKLAGCGKDFKHMRNLFYEMRRRGCSITPDTWAIMIMQYGRTGLTEIALRTFSEMKSKGHTPTASAYKYLIISLCGKKGRKVDEAIKLFQEMIQAGQIPDKELLETYLSCLCEVGKVVEARSCTDSLSKVGYTIPLSYSLYVRALCRAGRLEEALEIIDNVGTERSTLEHYVYGSLVHGLLQQDRLEEALAKVGSMKKTGICPTVHVYTSLIAHFFKGKQIERALEIFEKMKQEGCQPTVVTYSALIQGYMNMGKVGEAWDVLHQMKMKGPVPDFKTYSMFIGCLCKVGQSEEAMKLLSEMQENEIVPSTVNYRAVFFGLNREGKQDLAKIVLQQKSALRCKRKLLI